MPNYIKIYSKIQYIYYETKGIFFIKSKQIVQSQKPRRVVISNKMVLMYHLCLYLVLSLYKIVLNIQHLYGEN